MAAQPFIDAAAPRGAGVPPPPRAAASEPADAWPLIVVGGGAAGLFAASFAARAGCRTLVVDGRERLGAKIRVSGGGRCNVLPNVASARDFTAHASEATVRHVLATWPLADVRRYFEEQLGVPLKLEANGKLFPVSNQSRDVVAALLAELQQAGATLRAGSAVRRLSHRPGADWPWQVTLADGTVLRAQAVVLATGGLSMPKTGSDGSGLAMARAIGHVTWPSFPALVPLLGDADASQQDAFGQLSGISLPVTLEARRAEGGARLARWQGDFLFTHRGYSGPSVLNISQAFTQSAPGEVVLHAQFVDAEVPREQAQARLSASLAQAGTASVAQWIRGLLPRRLADVLLARAGLDGELAAGRASELSRPLRRKLLQVLTEGALPVEGDEGYRTAEVTGGGVSLAEVHKATLASRKVPGLYLAGEVLDVTGRLGGFNFLWAWVSGRLAGLAAARALAAAEHHASFKERAVVG